MCMIRQSLDLFSNDLGPTLRTILSFARKSVRQLVPDESDAWSMRFPIQRIRRFGDLHAPTHILNRSKVSHLHSVEVRQNTLSLLTEFIALVPIGLAFLAIACVHALGIGRDTCRQRNRGS